MSNAMKSVAIACITFYQAILSPDTGLVRWSGFTRGETCPFYPSCSEYAKEAIGRYGALRGGMKGMRRILRCHPWQKGGVDKP